VQANNLQKNFFGGNNPSNVSQKQISQTINSTFNAKDPFGSMSGKPAPKKQTNIY